MKKIIAVAAILIFGSAISVYAQPSGGGRGFGPAMKEVMEKEKQKLKEDLKLTDVQVDSVQAINKEFRGKMRGLRGLTTEASETAMKEINFKKLIRFSDVLNDFELAKKVVEFYEKQQKERMQMTQNRGGGGK